MYRLLLPDDRLEVSLTDSSATPASPPPSRDCCNSHQAISQSINRLKGKKGKGAYSSLWIGNPSQSYGASPAIWDHTVLHAT